MNKYEITYYYSASGMEGRADLKYEGIFEANSKEEAKEKCLEKNYKEDKNATFSSHNYKVWEFIRSCLKVRLIE